MPFQVIQNDTDHPVVLQIEPWADLLFLLPNERVTVALDPGEDRGFQVDRDEDGETWFVHLPFAETYRIVEGIMKIDHIDYGSNVIGYSRPLHPKSTLLGRLPLRTAGT